MNRQIPTSLFRLFPGAVPKAASGRSSVSGGKAKKREQTAGEERLNVLTHGAGALAAVAGTAVLLRRAAAGGSALAVVSGLIFGLSLIFLYTNSAIYHGTREPERKRRLRMLDHCSIFLLILGSYVPVALVTIGGVLGWGLVAVNTTLAAVGIASRIMSMNRGKSKLSVALYLMMGWLVILAIKPVIQAVPPVGLWLLLAGGVAYTAGVWFYKKNGPYMHVVWHLFVLAGSGLHYACVLLCCCG